MVSPRYKCMFDVSNTHLYTSVDTLTSSWRASSAPFLVPISEKVSQRLYNLFAQRIDNTNSTASKVYSTQGLYERRTVRVVETGLKAAYRDVWHGVQGGFGGRENIDLYVGLSR